VQIVGKIAGRQAIDHGPAKQGRQEIVELGHGGTEGGAVSQRVTAHAVPLAAVAGIDKHQIAVDRVTGCDSMRALAGEVEIELLAHLQRRGGIDHHPMRELVALRGSTPDQRRQTHRRVQQLVAPGRHEFGQALFGTRGDQQRG